MRIEKGLALPLKCLFPPNLKEVYSNTYEGRSNLFWQNLVVIVTLWAVSLANVKEVLYD